MTEAEVEVMQVHKPRNDKDSWKTPEAREGRGKVLP